VAALTKLLAGAERKGRFVEWHLSPAPEPAVAADPDMEQQVRYSFSNGLR